MKKAAWIIIIALVLYILFTTLGSEGLFVGLLGAFGLGGSKVLGELKKQSGELEKEADKVKSELEDIDAEKKKLEKDAGN